MDAAREVAAAYFAKIEDLMVGKLKSAIGLTDILVKNDIAMSDTNTKLTQEVNDICWNACDTFRGVMMPISTRITSLSCCS